MNSICINNNMINILSKLKGNKFISYECDLEENWNRMKCTLMGRHQ